MNNSKYYDSAAAIQVICCAFQQPDLLAQTGEYFFNESDFTNEFHRVMFGILYNLYNMGTTKFNIKIIEDYLEGREQTSATYKVNNGAEWLQKLVPEADLFNFQYYYDRLKKMTLLREYNNVGVNVDWLYDPDELVVEEKEKKNKYLDSLSLDEIANLIDDRILDVREAYVDNSSHVSKNIGEDLEENLANLIASPAIGARLYDSFTNSICMGARRGKFYLRSAATGVGKSRSMMADACQLACSEIYDLKEGCWVETHHHEETLFISVELDEEELQTMALAFVSGVDEDKILKIVEPNFAEAERIKKGIAILEQSNLYFEFLPDYGLVDIENSIKRNIRKNKVKYIFFDYITSSMKMMSDMTRQAGGVKLREDQILFQLASRLKDLANIYNVFIMSATQLNYTYKTDSVPNESLLAGSKAMANRIDVGMILLNVTKEDKEALQQFCEVTGYPMPNTKMSIYKNRRGKYVNVLLWMSADKGKCRYDSLFMTDFNYEPLNPPDDIVVEMVD